MRTLTLIVIVFVVFCGVLVIDSGIFKESPQSSEPCITLQQTIPQQKETTAAQAYDKTAKLEAVEVVTFGADNAQPKTFTLGSTDPDSGFKFELELDSRGAAVSKATFSEFDDRDYKNPQPLVILSPVKINNGEISSMANKEFIFVDHGTQLPLNKLHWRCLGAEKAPDGCEKATFTTVINITDSNEPVIKLVKTYKVIPGSYDLFCELTMENLAWTEQNVRFNLAGPLGLKREGIRSDMRKAVAGFRDAQSRIKSTRLDVRKLKKAATPNDLRLISNNDKFLWAASVNKYFAAVIVPLPDVGKDYCDWVHDKKGRYYNPDADKNGDTGDEAVGVDLQIDSSTLAPAGQPGSTKQYDFQLYLGPKDKRLFDKNEQYRNLGFVYTIDFMPCFCCPATIIRPLAFFILTLMNAMYTAIPNYGIVIIILVFLVRLVLHPLTKKSQISMSKMSKLAPKAEEIKKKYANKAEQQKHLMSLYKKQGASPVIGMVPMFIQMPIWISLYSAIYASISLRGAPFLPFWITDLSAPDALVRFSEVTLPLFGKLDSFNLLPILMGVAFFLQQKLSPTQATSSSNPQVAQQQKMMMIMLPVMFPLLLYKAPSGLNLYIMASTFAGVIEQHVIRRHIREKEETESEGLVAVTSKTGGKVKKKKPKPFYKQF